MIFNYCPYLQTVSINYVIDLITPRTGTSQRSFIMSARIEIYLLDFKVLIVNP